MHNVPPSDGCHQKLPNLVKMEALFVFFRFFLVDENSLIRTNLVRIRQMGGFAALLHKVGSGLAGLVGGVRC
ncbi:hypothetical protein ACFIQF_15505 [Comamonas sp. J-3]